jgi:hypothetical protein
VVRAFYLFVFRERHEVVERGIVADGRIRPNWLSERTRNAMDDVFRESAVDGTEVLPRGIRFDPLSFSGHQDTTTTAAARPTFIGLPPSNGHDLNGGLLYGRPPWPSTLIGG